MRQSKTRIRTLVVFSPSALQYEIDQAFNHFRRHIAEAFKKLSEQDQRIIQSKAAEILGGMHDNTPRHGSAHVKRTIPLATADLAYFIETLGKEVFADAIKAGKVVPHGPGPAAGPGTEVGGTGAVTNVPAMLNTLGTYAGVFALGVIITVMAMGKSLNPFVTATTTLAPDPTMIVLVDKNQWVSFFSSPRRCAI
ncbi:hypothetical protein FRB95_012629 [Tulasnella sp. JGI-2019a]|nr:hypothetical protein FRB95_012629 [Tulasnella sp. JGI-2019a]